MVDASTRLARKCIEFLRKASVGSDSGANPQQQPTKPSDESQARGSVPGSYPSSSSNTTNDPSSPPIATHDSTAPSDTNNQPPKESYILFCIYQRSQIWHAQIRTTKCRTDEDFFDQLRQEYRRLRGFWRFWLSPLQFDHCEFVKFTRFYVNELAKVGRDLPIDLVYQYNPRPPGPRDDPPISPHEFRRRFYTHLANPCGRGEAMERIPKRQKRFQVNLHVDGREDMWGLHAELRPCFLIILTWQIIITAGGWAFMGWWLSRHNGDLQNAAVPITLIVSALLMLWVPISESMKVTL
jgi:hypothetical protein